MLFSFDTNPSIRRIEWRNLNLLIHVYPELAEIKSITNQIDIIKLNSSLQHASERRHFLNVEFIGVRRKSLFVR